MKRSDKERLKKIVATWESLKAEMHKRGITPELLLEDEFSQWAVTTPLYNIGEQVYQLSPEFKASYPEQPGIWLPGCATGWCMTTTVSTGASSSKSCLRIWSPL